MRKIAFMSLGFMAIYVYGAQEGLVNFDQARRSQIEPSEEHHSRVGKVDEEARFGKVAAGQNSPNLTEHRIAAFTDVPDHSKPLEMATHNLKLVNVYDLSEHDLIEIMQGKRPEVAVEFSAQTALPISFFLKGDLVNLSGEQGNFAQVEVKQTFYARYVQEELILSSNLTEWKPLLEFITGTASVALSIQDGQPSIVFGAETNRRI